MQKTPKTERTRRVAEMLELCRIQELSKRPVRALSGGQRQRVAIARALAVRPRVLLLDEPLAALDPQLRIALRADLKELLRESGVTSLFVTHDQSEALALADKVLVLRKGEIEQIGTPEELWNSPANEFVAEFLNNSIVVLGKALDGRTVEFAGSFRCRTARDVPPGREVRLALRKENFEISTDGSRAVVTACEYGGGLYQAKARLDNGARLPVSSREELAVGTAILVAVKKDAEITVVGPYE